MCLTIPKQVISVKKDFIEVKSAKGKERLGAFIAVKKGDWVLSQNSIIIKKISQKQAKEINNLLSS
ncbi:HypC/HybG/HupF family hydrogenase formation chaperone [Patescibacteria group bacterium]|nr:HypC/HybG/HupF family hydrogenase formation chaperone [Patescibacteria group bacterium]